jgi:hypothetical protein
VLYDFKKLFIFIIVIVLILIETTIIGPSPLPVIMLDSGDLYFGYKVYSIIYYNKLLA